MRASLWIGSASSLSFIVTLTPGESPPTGSIFETLPTSTPAIRTAWPFVDRRRVRRSTALSSYGFVNGMSFVNAEEGDDQDHHERDQARLERA